MSTQPQEPLILTHSLEPASFLKGVTPRFLYLKAIGTVQFSSGPVEEGVRVFLSSRYMEVAVTLAGNNITLDQRPNQKLGVSEEEAVCYSRINTDDLHIQLPVGTSTLHLDVGQYANVLGDGFSFEHITVQAIQCGGNVELEGREITAHMGPGSSSVFKFRPMGAHATKVDMFADGGHHTLERHVYHSMFLCDHRASLDIHRLGIEPGLNHHQLIIQKAPENWGRLCKLHGHAIRDYQATIVEPAEYERQVVAFKARFAALRAGHG